MAGDLKLPDLTLPKQVTEITDKLRDHGYWAYIHGECVRELIKGQTLYKESTFRRESTLLDFDLVTDADFSRIRAIFDGYNIVESGGFVVRVQGVSVSVSSYPNLESALRDKHDFTFDAIAYSGDRGLCDPFDGIGATENGEIRRLVLTKPETQTFSRKDLEKILMSRYIKDVLSECSDVIIAMIPELKMLNEDFLSRTFKGVGASSPILSLRYALLFRETGKPDCHSRDSDDCDFYYGHAERSRIYAARIMARLGCAPDDVRETEYIIENCEKVRHADVGNIRDICDDYDTDLLKLLLLFNCAVCRAESDEKAATRFKKLLTLI